MPDPTNLTTAEGLDTLNSELAALEGEGRREMAERIRTAREWGDLKENSEYHDAKNEQAHLETKIARLREKIAAAVVVEEAPAVAGGVVGLGSTYLTATRGTEIGTLTIGAWTARPKNGTADGGVHWTPVHVPIPS